jgi:Ca2+-binding EF-hand superfamily protein
MAAPLWCGLGCRSRTDGRTHRSYFKDVDFHIKMLMPETPIKDREEGLDRTELESIKRVFEGSNRKNDGTLASDRDEIAQHLDMLDYRPKRHTDYGPSEVEDMLWEMDEDCDGKIDWDNFVQLYIRCCRDKTG